MHRLGLGKARLAAPFHLYMHVRSLQNSTHNAHLRHDGGQVAGAVQPEHSKAEGEAREDGEDAA